MKRLNSIFILLILILGLLSIAYIWKSEEDATNLETKINKQTQEISSLKNQVVELEKKESNLENVKGVTTAVGTITGLVQINDTNSIDTTIVCAQDKFTIKEFCTDELIKTANAKKFQYTLEIPRGKYFIYTISPPSSEKIYYSEIQKCTDDNCENSRKILLEVIENEVQKDINLYF